MASPLVAELPKRQISFDIPQKLGFLFQPHRYKVAWGGRGGAKSRSYATALLAIGVQKDLRVLCAREVQRSIKDSVHQLLEDQINRMNLQRDYDVLAHEIRGRRNSTNFSFSGMQEHTVDSLKSYEGVDVCWVEEGQGVSKRSWQILIPTIRKDESEIWVSMNPNMEEDETYQRFVVNPPDNAYVCKINYMDNPWFPAVLEEERLDCLRRETKEDYENIWLGVPRSTVIGAIYATEMRRMEEERRLRPTPYDPRFPVNTVWDLGWNDKMAVIMFQKVGPSTVNIINYYENNFVTYAQVIGFLNSLPYYWDTDYLPHDARNKDPKDGMSAEMVVRKLGRKRVRILGRQDKGETIRQARMLFPRIYIDNTERQMSAEFGGYVGGKRLVDCLRRYRRSVPTTTGEPAQPVHDEFSHGADAYGGLSWIADRVQNPSERTPSLPYVEPFVQEVEGMGVLG